MGLMTELYTLLFTSGFDSEVESKVNIRFNFKKKGVYGQGNQFFLFLQLFI